MLMPVLLFKNENVEYLSNFSDPSIATPENSKPRLKSLK
jgi:hypothetical protein